MMDSQATQEKSATRTLAIEQATILPADKKAGVGMHFTSLSSPYGIGDIGDAAAAFIDRLVSMNIRFWQFLPTGPTAYGDSPYQPLSAFAGNEMLIGMEPLIRIGLLHPGEADALRGLPAERVDYGNLIPLKQALLTRAAERFASVAGVELKSAYAAFLARHDSQWLGDYALYRILKSQHGERPWPEWEKPCVQRQAEVLRQVQKNSHADIEKVKIIQFLFDQQWRELRHYAHERGISLFGDMPIYIALDSSDAWAHPEILLIDEDGRPSHVAGVPPDYFSADGQLWGNPLYDWKYHESNGYQWWIERLQHAASQVDLVRIDHFRGFESFWAVRFGAQTAREGAWLPGPGDGLFNAMKTALGSLPIVAEDLGVITPEVDALRHRHNIPGMKVLQFEVGAPDFDIADIGRDCVCYTGTHDNDTTVGWFNGAGDDTRTAAEIAENRRNTLRVTGGNGESIHLDLVRLAFNSRARLAIVPLQDFMGLGSGSRLNTPGTTSDNWRWRVTEAQLSAEFCRSVADLIQETARS
jgi:4-alpha-glucanotransferase